MTSIPLILLRRSIFNQVVDNVLDELGAPSPVEAATTALMQSLGSAAQEAWEMVEDRLNPLSPSNTNTDDEEMEDKAERNVRLAASQHVKLADLLPTHEVFEVVKDVRVLFSFGSRLGGLDLAVKLRAELAERWGPGAGYVDLVHLRSHRKTRTVELTLPDGKQITKVLNPHWAEFYYMCMVFTETTVLIMDKAWTGSGFYLGEWQLFLRNMNRTHKDAATGERKKSYYFRFVVINIYDVSAGGEFAIEAKARETLCGLGIAEPAAMIPACHRGWGG
jgi:hypothetical protein